MNLTRTRSAGAAVAGAVLLTGSLLAMAPAGSAAASALAPFSPVAASTVAAFTLTPQNFASDSQETSGVEASGAVTVRDADDLLSTVGHAGSPTLCHATGLSSALSPSGFCWDAADDTSDSWTAAGGWTPQGLSGSYDADSGGTWDGHTAYLASWHFDQAMNTSAPQPNEFARLSLVNADNGQINYNHMLLVQPTSTSTGDNFVATPNTHADGVVWYGDDVFVADGRFLQVYSLSHVWKMSSNTSGAVGINGGVSSARYSNYALPMIGEYYTTASPSTACTVAGGTTPCLNSLSLDRTAQGDFLVSSEYDTSGGGRVMEWPLDSATRLPSVNGTGGTTHATVAYSSAVLAMQGAATDGTDFYLAGSCPSGVGTGSGDSSPYSCIWQAAPNGTPSVLTTSPVLTENLGYSPSANRIWGLNERINSTVGIRVVFSVTP